MGECIGITTRKPVMAKDIEDVPVQHETLPFDPKIEEVMLRMQDMDEEGRQDIFRYVMKLRNLRHIQKGE